MNVSRNRQQALQSCGVCLGRFLVVLSLALLSNMARAADAVEAASSCVVIHEQDDSDSERSITCFENNGLERSSFESGVCQWQTESQIATQVQTTTQFVAHCPESYGGYCDRLVLGPNVVAPVKIFVYDKAEGVLERAEKQCLSGGGEWTANAGDAE